MTPCDLLMQNGMVRFGMISERVVNDLDVLAELYRMRAPVTGYLTPRDQFHSWLRDCLSLGLITADEHLQIKNEVGRAGMP